ncbi:MAG TPA: hypothetical protein VHI13_09145 [Candidatus Kapabacteria bacterium]|nr:hypothetical protein [Candidatus Kapabacteria bacterium]
MFEYRVVPFSGTIKGRGSVGDVSMQLQDEINRQAHEGWEFYQLGSVNIEVKPGCLGGMLGASTFFFPHNQIVFRREATEVPEAEPAGSRL